MKSLPKKTKIVNSVKGVPNKVILIFAILMSIFGLIMIFDASVYQANHGFNDQFHFLKLQAIWLVASVIIGTIIYLIDYRKLAKLSMPALIVVIGLLLAVLIFGDDVNGSKRWFSLGPIPVQPAEFLKPVIILYLASWLAKQPSGSGKFEWSNLKHIFKIDFAKKLLTFAIIIGFVLGLVILEPDLGTTMIIGLTSLAIFFISGTDTLHQLGTIALTGVFGLLAVFAGVLESYRFKRITTFLSLIFTGEVAEPRKEGYQMQQILIGIGSGGLFGVGFGQSRQRYGYLVENTAFTDSIFAIILEELGLVGGFVILLSWILFLWTGLKIALKAPDRLGMLLASGITIWLVLQAFLNMAANVGLMPLTGIPLPFLTYGGSNTLVTVIGIAFLLNVSKYRK